MWMAFLPTKSEGYMKIGSSDIMTLWHCRRQPHVNKLCCSVGVKEHKVVQNIRKIKLARGQVAWYETL